MKFSIFLLITFFALTSFFSTQNLVAQELAMTNAAAFSQPAASLSKKENLEQKHKFDLDAGQRSAHFKGFAGFVGEQLIYPELARKNSIEGTVQVLLVISDEGKILSAKIVKSLGFGCDEAALAVVLEMPDWSPAMNFGIPVKSKSIVAIDFRLR